MTPRWVRQCDPIAVPVVAVLIVLAGLIYAVSVFGWLLFRGLWWLFKPGN